MHQPIKPDAAYYEALNSDDLLFCVRAEDGEHRVLPVLSRVVVERRAPLGAIKPTLRLARALLRNDAPGGPPRTSRLIDVLSRAAGRGTADRERPFEFQVLYRARRDGFDEPQVVLRQTLTGCKLVADELTVQAGTTLVLDEVTFVCDALAEE